VADFLTVVVKQNGKALTAAQRKQFDEAFIKRVQADDLVVEAGANKYKLSPKGEEFRQGRELEEQLKGLRTDVQNHLEALEARLQRFAKDTEQLAQGGAIRSAFGYAEAVLQTFAGLTGAAQTLEKALPGAVSRALASIAAEVERVQKLETGLRQTADQIREQLGQTRQQMELRVAAVEEKARAAKQPAGAAGTTPAPTTAPVAEPPADEAVWQATQRAYAQLEQRFKLTSELIKVPNLTDLVRTELPELTAARFHDLLQRWQREDRLVLQVCNDPHVEPRAAEGIPSSRGLLFYLEMK
jgi:hypothetical protein